MAKGHDMDDVPVSGGGNKKKPADVVELFKLPNNKFVKLRFVGSVFAYGGHWVETVNKTGKPTSFFTTCAAFDTETGQVDSTKDCPWCKDDSGKIKSSVEYFSNAISRSEQKNEPSKIKPTKTELASGFKDKDSDTWTPMKAVRLTASVLRRLRELKQLNTHENEDGDSVSYSISHPKFGCDVSLKLDPDAAPAQMYEVQLGTHAPIRKAERSYLPWDLSDLMDFDSESAANLEYKKWAKRMGFTSDDEDDEDEDTPPSKSKKKKLESKASSKSKGRKDEDDEDSDDDDEDDEPPAKAGKSKAQSKKGKKSYEDDEDSDDEDENLDSDDEDSDDDDEDEPPAKSKKAAKSAKKTKSKKSDDDEDDEDLDDDDEDEPPRKSKSKPAKKGKKAPVDDEDDEDSDDEDGDEDEDEDEDEDDEPPKKSKSKSKAKSAKKTKSKKSDDDEDDDDDDF